MWCHDQWCHDSSNLQGSLSSMRSTWFSLFLKVPASDVTGLMILDFSSVFSENVQLKENIKTLKLKTEKLLERKRFLDNDNNRLRYLLHRWVKKNMSSCLSLYIFSYQDEAASLNSEQSLLQDVKSVSLSGQISLQKIGLEKIQKEVEESWWVTYGMSWKLVWNLFLGINWIFLKGGQILFLDHW